MARVSRCALFVVFSGQLAALDEQVKYAHQSRKQFRWEGSEMNVLLKLGIILLLVIGGKIARAFKLPNVSGYLVAGLFSGAVLLQVCQCPRHRLVYCD